MSLSFPRLRRPPAADPAPETEPAGDRRQRVVARVRTVLAGLVVFVALVGPDDYGHLTPGAFVRIPVEGLVAAALVLVLPQRWRRPVAATGGTVLGLLAILKIIDIGFSAILDRPFNLALDWGLLGSATGVVRASVGTLGAVGAVVGAGLLVAGVLVATIRSALRLTAVTVRHRTATTRGLAALGVAWITCAALGAQLVPGLPLADRGTATLVYHRAVQVRDGLADNQVFARQEATDAFANTPPNQLLTGLRGKDVLFTFIESYGRSAIEDPGLAPTVLPVLDDASRRLAADGYSARTAFLTSSTVGGGSWLAHSTLFSGLWIDNQQRYHSLVSGTRLTLPRTFTRAGWRTVTMEPAVHGAWPERVFYGYDRGYDQPSFGYRGPHYSYAPMPDQYVFATLQRDERTPGHAPLMAELTLTSSHTPFTPIPRLVNWDTIGDGTVFGRPENRQGGPGSSAIGSPSRMRTAYANSIAYSLSALFSYIEKYGDNNLVLVFLGDHQPAPIVTGAGASRDVPITVIARDPAVLDRISSWGWQPGLRPAPNAPVWRMDTFRDHFLTAFAR